MVPVCPVKVIVVPNPEHIVGLVAVAVPPAEAGITVIITVLDVAWEQTPLFTTALYYVVCVNAPGEYVDEVAPEIFVKVELSVDDCHWTLPVYPAKVNTVGEFP